MNFSTVVSSFIESIGYDANTQTMEVKFKNGSSQQHPNTPPSAHRQLLHADSVGKHYNANFKGAAKATPAIKKNPIR